MDEQKPIHTLVLDTGAIIKNDPPVSTLLQQCESLATVPAILSEIKDAATRSRVETTLRPFLTVRSPNPASLNSVTEFARRTGDLAVLSKADLQIIALTYEIECERNGGDWRLRRVPGQKGVNGAPPSRAQEELISTHAPSPRPDDGGVSVQEASVPAANQLESKEPAHEDLAPSQPEGTVDNAKDHQAMPEQTLTEDLAQASLDDEPNTNSSIKTGSAQTSNPDEESSDSDSEGWITPSNLKKKQAEDADASTTQTAEPKIMQAAVITTDFAMQNVILQMNLNLLSRSLTRVKHLKTFVLRCHACFQTTKDMSKQFCPRCGQAALTRVSCSTSANGEFKLHLKKTMQWNHRGERYSVPKPVSGSANGRVKGGGKNGWGNELIFAEDQKEYQRAVVQEKKMKTRDLMDEDYLPGILTGDRRRDGGRIKVGAGRNVNSRKR